MQPLKLSPTFSKATSSLSTTQTRLATTQQSFDLAGTFDQSPITNLLPVMLQAILQIMSILLIQAMGRYSTPDNRSSSPEQPSVPTNTPGSQPSGITKVNNQISVLGTSQDAKSKDEDGEISLKAADGIQTGDVMVMTIGGSDGDDDAAPPEGWKLIKKEGDGDLNVSTYYKVYEQGDETEFQVAKNGAANYFASLSTLRGVDPNNPVVDAASDNNTGSGKSGEANAPSVNGVINGAQFVVFMYDDPHVATINGVNTLNAFKNGDDGIATGIISTDNNGMTSIIGAQGQGEEAGGGRDQAMTITFRPL
jgi:hypothetical protein